MTAPEFRNKGHFSEMMNFAFQELNRGLVDFIFLLPQTPDLIALYEKFGFKPAFKQPLKRITHFKSEEQVAHLSEPAIPTAYNFYLQASSGYNGIIQSETQFAFNVLSVKQEGGEFLALIEENKIVAVCFVLLHDNEVRILDLITTENHFMEKMLVALKARYNVNSFLLTTSLLSSVDGETVSALAVISPKSSLKYKDLSESYLSLMMNE
jgi:hypothetical protein